MSVHRPVVVVGAGVAGLSTALRLLEAGRRVLVLTADDPLATTSSVAAALWYPYRAFPQSKVLAWGRRAFEVFTELASDPATGVALRDGIEVLAADAPGMPWWAGIVPGVRPCEPDELPPGAQGGWGFRVPVIAMPVYLAWLLDRVETAGGIVQRRRLGSLAEVAGGHSAIVNCSGLGARELAGDATVTAIQGQIVRVENPGLTDFLLDQGTGVGADVHPRSTRSTLLAPARRPLTYIVPRSSDCVLGGTAAEGAWELDPDPAVAEAIVARCVAYEPRLAGARVLEHRVGLRPARPSVRLEIEHIGTARCVHHYGHGGAGVTLSWGTAEEAVRLVTSA